MTRVSVRIPGEVVGDSATIAGSRLWDVLQRAVVALVEVDPSFSEQVIPLAESCDGRPLDAVEGFWRAIVFADRRHARWIRDVVEIEVTSLR